MESRAALRQITKAGRVMGIVFIAIGVALALLALAAHTEASGIGASTDPELTQKYADLTHLRDMYIILSIAAFFLGTFSFTILAERSINPIASEAEMISQARIASQILAGLNLKGNAAYVPSRGPLHEERIFIPAGGNSAKLPSALTNDLVFSPGKDGSTPGALFSPSGLDLLTACEKETGRKLAGIGLEALEAELQTLKFGFGLMKDFHIKERDGKVILRVEYSALAGPCRQVRKELPDTCRQMSCFGCSCIMAGITRATGRAVRVAGVDNSKERVVFELEYQ
jgi:hypothetical protein